MTEDKLYDYLVFIGRFQPFHNGHKRVVEEALQQADKVIILIGSSDQGRSFRNPWLFSERKSMINLTFHNETDRLIIKPIHDKPYNDQAWITGVNEAVHNAALVSYPGNSEMCTLHGLHDMKIGLIGHSKDETSYYLNLFPNWGNINVDQHVIYNATDIRDAYFAKAPVITRDIIPEEVGNFMASFLEAVAYRDLYNEHVYIKNYKQAWESTPYPVTFVTTDAIVVQSGHILLIRRKAQPGKGLWALPGGFLNQQETVENGMIRELREETMLKVPDPVLRGNIKKQKVFDDPNRSARGRVITNAFLIELPAGPLPKVKGADDADKAEWKLIAELPDMQLFEDHYAIIENMLGETL